MPLLLALAALFVFGVIMTAGWLVDRDYQARRESELAKVLGYFTFTLEARTSNSRAMGALILLGAQNRNARALAGGDFSSRVRGRRGRRASGGDAGARRIAQ